MAFAQINAAALNGPTTIYKREGAYYKAQAVSTQSHNGSQPLPVTRITSQLEIDAINADWNKHEIYNISVYQLAQLLNKKQSDVKTPAVPNVENIDVKTQTAAAGVTLAINGEAAVKTIVVRIGVSGKPGADQILTTDGNVGPLKTIAGHTLAAGDVVSVTFAQFNGTYTTVDEALTSLEDWHWAKPYLGITIN